MSATEPVEAYQGRVSKGREFSFSNASLKQALYRVSVDDIHIRIDKADLKALFQKDANDYSSFKIGLIDGRHKLSGTIEVLGSSTRILKKKSLLIKLDKLSAPWYGRRKIALQAMATGKAMMQEWMAWKLMAAMGMKVPEVHFTRVSFNHGEEVGLYLSIEWIGRRFLADNYPDVKENLYEARAVACADWKSSKNLRRCFNKIIPPDDDYSLLSDIIKTVASAKVGEMDAVLAKHFDDESVLNWIAVNTLLTDGDTYNKNYWLLYGPDTKRWTVLPWDYDLTFGRVYDPFINAPDKQGDPKKFYNDKLTIFNDNFQYYFPPDLGAGNPLKDKVLRNPRLRARLEIKLKHLLGIEPNGPKETYGWFSPIVMDARIGTLAAVVGKELYKDTFLTYGEEEFTKSYEALMHYVSARDHYLKAKLQGSYKWQPSPPYDSNTPPEPLPETLYGEGTIKAGGLSVQMTDQGWGYFVARLNLDEPLKQNAQFKVHIAGGATPEYLPPGESPNHCIRRSWEVSTETFGIAAEGNLMVEYVQQNSKRTEVPVTLHEKLLQLWMRDGSDWRLLKTEVNEYANTLIARDVHLKYGHIQYFVACSPF